jgi:uncharacterized protein (DUF305 family)
MEEPVVRSVGPTRCLRRALLLVAAILAWSTGCTADGAGDGQEAGPKIIQPGRPGEPARTLDPDARVPQSRWNRADARFVQMMIPHHAQALRMSALARNRAQDPRVLALAERIRGAQGPEVVAMSAWLAERGLDDASMHHGHHQQHNQRQPAPMPGMLSAAQMRRLAHTDGHGFDRLFLASMIRHHRGAVQMASDALQRGTDLRVNEIAGDVAAEQDAEIARMRQVLGSLRS